MDKNKKKYIKYLKSEIKAALENINECESESIFVLEFIYGAISKFIPSKDV